jgi:hypothetical protein
MMLDFEAAAAETIAATFAAAIVYTGAGLDRATIPAIRTERSAEPFEGPGATLREVAFEVRQEHLPEDPRKSDLIEDGDDQWQVNDITRRDDVGAWRLIVVRAA